MKQYKRIQVLAIAAALVMVAYGCSKDDADSNPSPRSDLEGVWIEVPVGRYVRGSAAGLDIERPVDTVHITKAFYLSATEITNKKFADFLNAKGVGEDGKMTGTRAGTQVVVGNSAVLRDGKFHFGVEYINGTWQSVAGYDYYPAIYVTWFGADEYCKWLTAKEPGSKYRLPREAEWEWAAGYIGQGLKKKKYPTIDSTYKYAGFNEWGNLGAYAWYNVNSGGRSRPVGTRLPNPLGLYDMLGNVNEWCADWFGADYYQLCSDSATLYAKTQAKIKAGVDTGAVYNAYYVAIRDTAKWLMDPKGPDSAKVVYDKSNNNPNKVYTSGQYYPYTRGARRIMRGGSYVEVQTSGTEGTHRVSYRGHMQPQMVWNSYGFRVLKEK